MQMQMMIGGATATQPIAQQTANGALSQAGLIQQASAGSFVSFHFLISPIMFFR